MSDRLQITRHSNGVADVRLNRPDKRNSIDGPMFKALVEGAAELADDPTLRCVVLSGEGPSFCAGLDFSSFAQAAEGPSSGDGLASIFAVPDDRVTHEAQQAVYGWSTLPVPVIAAIQGHALGGGIQLALGADIRLVHPEAALSVLEIRWGIIPDMTGTQTLIELVGLDVAKEMTFTGRMVSGTEAVSLGLCTRLAGDPLAAALELADEIAGKSPDAIRAGKRLFHRARQLSRAEGFAHERHEMQQLLGSPNQLEQVAAFFEKRPANFADPQVTGALD
jgi:enoyl-CoA hydratase/carnithine racemase